MTTVSLIVPTIPPRADKLGFLRKNIEAQTRQPDEVIVVEDTKGIGAAAARNLGLADATGDYVALFDDDDVMFKDHIKHLVLTAAQHDADFVYPWHELVPKAPNPLAVAGRNPEGRPFDDRARKQILAGYNFIPVAVLIRRSLLEQVGGFTDFGLAEWDPAKCELLDCWQRLLRADAKFVHCPKRTWAAVRSGHNTAGLDWTTHMGTKQAGYR